MKEKPIYITKEVVKEKPVYIEVPAPPQMPVPKVKPVVEQPVEECIPVTPILPGTGFCYPPPPPLPLQWACPPVECIPFECAPVGCAPVDCVQQPFIVPAPVIQANVESSDVWGESSSYYPDTVAGVSTSPVPQPYPTQASTRGGNAISTSTNVWYSTTCPTRL